MFDIMPLPPPRATCREARAHQAAPAIPEDVLFEILSHLSFQDRLKISQVRPPDHASPSHSYCSSDAQAIFRLTRLHWRKRTRSCSLPAFHSGSLGVRV